MNDSRKRYLCGLIFDVFKNENCFADLALEVLKDAQGYLLKNTPVARVTDLPKELAEQYLIKE